MKHLLFAIGILAFTQPTEAKKICVKVLKETRAVTFLNGEKKRTYLYKGEVFPFIYRDKSNKSFKVLIGDKKFWSYKKKLRLTKRNRCRPRVCVKVDEAMVVFRQPLGQEETSLAGVFPVVSRTNVQGQYWYRVQDSKWYFWLKKSDYRQNKVSCDTQALPLPSEAPSEKLEVGEQSQEIIEPTKEVLKDDPTERKWRFGIEGGLATGLSKKALENLLTPDIPSASTNVNTDDYDSPFIEKVNSGQGMSAAVFVETSFFLGSSIKLLLGYMKRDYEYVSRPNPYKSSPSFIRYDELTTKVETLSFTSFYFTVFPKYSFRWKSLDWHVGLSLKALYYPEEVTVEFRTAPQKLTAYHVKTGYSELAIELLPRAEVQWSRFYLYLDLANEITPSSDWNFAPSLGLGVNI